MKGLLSKTRNEKLNCPIQGKRTRKDILENLDPYTKLQNLREQVKLGGGEDKIASQKKRGKLTARERIDLLVDAGTFVELDAFAVHDCADFGMDEKKVLGDGVVTGWATVEGRLVYLFSQDFTVFGGSLSAMYAKKIVKIMKMAVQNGAPVIGINDSGGARIHEGVASLGGYADIFYQNVQASGVVPQLSLVMGPCAGGAVYSPAMTDFIFMVDDTSHMFITGPDVIKTVTGEEVTFDELGGSSTHTSTSGVVDKRFPSELEAIEAAKEWLRYIPSNNLETAPTTNFETVSDGDKAALEKEIESAKARIGDLVPTDPNQPYEMKDVISCVVDPGSFWEVKEEFAPNIVTGFGRLAGHSVGIIGNNPNNMAGVLDIDASSKAARFVRFCDAFGIPLVTFVDVPGFLPGTDQEKGGIIRHGAKLLYAYCEATVPKLTVITRKAYGGAYDVMSSKHIGADLNLAWPRAEIAVMGAEGACNIIFRGEIKKAKDPVAERARLTNEYSQIFATPYKAAEKGYIDAVIFPAETRHYLIQGLRANMGKRAAKPKRRHGNIPL